MNEIELIPRLGDLVKMKNDGDYGLVGVVHKVRSIGHAARLFDPSREGDVYDIAWPDVRSVQYLSEIRVISRS